MSVSKNRNIFMVMTTLFAQESDCIVVTKFIKQKLTNPPPKMILRGFYTDPWFNKYESYYKFMMDLSKGKNVRSLDLPKEDTIEHMKIHSEAVRILVRVVKVLSGEILPLIPAKAKL